MVLCVPILKHFRVIISCKTQAYKDTFSEYSALKTYTACVRYGGSNKESHQKLLWRIIDIQTNLKLVLSKS